jgi:hypothetical protein
MARPVPEAVAPFAAAVAVKVPSTPAMRSILVALALAATWPAAAAGSLPFVEDDYATALADARARNVPLVVDVWAPW